MVLVQAPKSLDELAEWVGLIAAHADPAVTVYLGGRVKYLTPAMNEVLGLAFDTVTAGLARQKSRVIIASGLRDDVALPEFPRREWHADLALMGVRARRRVRRHPDRHRHPAAARRCSTSCRLSIGHRPGLRHRRAGGGAGPAGRPGAGQRQPRRPRSARVAATVEANGVAGLVEVRRDDALGRCRTAAPT